MTSRYVWEVVAVGASDPHEVKQAVRRALDRLTGGQHDEIELGPRELRPWIEDVAFVTVHEPATGDGRVSILVDVELRDQGGVAAHTAAVLSGGFDTCVLDEALQVAGVTEVRHSDRISRPA